MIWLTWRQFRIQAVAVYVLLALLALVLALTGAQLAQLSHDTGRDFLAALAAGDSRARVYTTSLLTVLAVPAVIGVFWGAPLIARELETGTYRLAWTQSVTRTRWLATKVGLIGLAAVLATAAVSLALTWWSGPIDHAIAAGQSSDGAAGMSRMQPVIFAARGIAPIGYAAFAFALGIATGLVIRRTVPAMAVTLAIFIVVQIAVPPLIRAHLSPASVSAVIKAESITGLQARVGPNGPVGPIELQVDIKKPGAWILSNKTVDSAGREVSTLPSFMANCFPPPPGAPRAAAPVDMPACFARLTRLGYRQRVTYQPNGRYWTLQAIETALFLTLAGALGGFSLWRLRRIA